MTTRYNTISFLSDLGVADESVGVVHSVIRTIAPDARTIDITHGITPHDIRAGSLCLARAVQYVAPGVVLAVIDPTVGTARRAIAVEVGDGAGVLVGPDNGLLASAVAMTGGATRAIELTNAEYHLGALGQTFSCRDVFAPVAAHLCNGIDLTEIGSEIDPLSLMPGLMPLARSHDGALIAEVLWVDHFGNAQLNIGIDDLEGLLGGEPAARVRMDFTAGGRVGFRMAGIKETFANIASSDAGLISDSYGLLSICLNQRSAADELGIHVGTEITLSALTA